MTGVSDRTAAPPGPGDAAAWAAYLDELDTYHGRLACSLASGDAVRAARFDPPQPPVGRLPAQLVAPAAERLSRGVELVADLTAWREALDARRVDVVPVQRSDASAVPRYVDRFA